MSNHAPSGKHDDRRRLGQQESIAGQRVLRNQEPVPPIQPAADEQMCSGEQMRNQQQRQRCP
jgi:hypothetical protein